MGLLRWFCQCCCGQSEGEARELNDPEVELPQTDQQVIVSMLSGESWTLTVNSRTTTNALKDDLATRTDIPKGEMQLVCGSTRLKAAERVLLVCVRQGLPMDALNLHLIREEDREAARRRWSEVPGLMDEDVHEKWPALHQAAHAGDLPEMRRLLEGRANPNQETSYLRGVSACGLTPLHVASARGHTDAVELLLDAGADNKNFQVLDNQFQATKDAIKCAQKSGHRNSADISAMLERRFSQQRSNG